MRTNGVLFRGPAPLAAILCGALASPFATPEASGAGVVGTGNAASCTDASLNAALTGGGAVSFNCGAGVAVIPIASTKTIAIDTSIDGAGNQIVLDGQNARRVFQTNYQRSLTVRNLTIRNARTADYGAGIRCNFQDRGFPALTVENVVFDNDVCTNTGDDQGGGAIYVQGGVTIVRQSRFTGNRGANGGAIGFLGGGGAAAAHNGLTIEDSVFIGNATNARTTAFSGSGGALYVDGSGEGDVRLTRCTFRDNTGWQGGAISAVMYLSTSALVVEDSTFLGNEATGANGGAIYHQEGAVQISGSLLAGNRAFVQGGGLWEYHPTGGSIVNSTFTGNRAEGVLAPTGFAVGGGLAIYPVGAAVSVTLSHLTIAGNHAGWTGGGVSIASPSTGVSLHASIVANNTADDGGNPWNIGKNCGSSMTDGGDDLEWPQRNLGDANDHPCAAGVVVADPKLGVLANHGGATATVALLPASAALDAVLSACPAPSTDQRGVARPQGVRCDIGAVEGTETPARFFPVTPCRLLDTRIAPLAAVAPMATLRFDVAGACGVPATAKATALNATAVTPTANGGLRLFSAGSGLPAAQALAVRTGRTRAGNVFSATGALGQVAVYNDSAAPLHVVVDVSGYFE